MESESSSSSYCFFVGNKRSGTTLITQALNLHPDIFTPHEIDIVNWITETQSQKDWHEGLEKTINFLGKPKEVSKKHFNESILKFNAGKTPKILGDKKPVQHLDYLHRTFVKDVLGGAKYIHIIRHPYGFFYGCEAIAKKYPLNIWAKNWPYNKHEVMDLWAKNVLEAEKLGPTFRIEDFVENPRGELKKMFDYLEVEDTLSNNDISSLGITRERLNTLAINLSDSALKICEKYNYAIG